MKEKGGLIIFAIILIIISIGGGYFSTVNYYNNSSGLYINKTGNETLTGSLIVNSILNTSITGYSQNLIGVKGYSANSIGIYGSTIGGIAGYFDNKVVIDGELDIMGNNLSNCGNCLTNGTMNKSLSGYDNDIGYITNTTGNYVKKTGDEMTGNLNISGTAEIYLNTTKSFSYIFGTVPRLQRSSTISYVREAPLASLNMVLRVAGGLGNGGGPGIVFWNMGNDSENNFESNVGRFAYVWRNKTANTTEAQFYVRNGILDINALSPAFKAYVKNNNYYSIGTEGVQNGTIETGDLKLLNMTATGSPQPICLSSTNTLIICP